MLWGRGYEQINPQLSVTTGGNSELLPETSNSYTLSLVYGPSWAKQKSFIDDLTLELTYFRIDLGGAIQALDAQVQLDRCVNTLDPVLCAGINRTGTGIINGFDNQLSNIGGIVTDGLDLTLSYSAPRMPSGRYRVTSSSSYLLRFNESIPSANGFEDVTRAGKEVGDPERGFPRFKSSLILDWFRGDLAASLTFRYIHSLTESCRGFGDYPGTCSDPDADDDSLSKNLLAPTVYGDAQVTWTPRTLDSRLDITAGVNNLFNQEPPFCYSCALNGFDASTYDIPGVFGYLRAGYRM